MKDLAKLDEQLHLILTNSGDPKSYTYANLAEIFQVSEDTIKRAFGRMRRKRVSIANDPRTYQGFEEVASVAKVQNPTSEKDQLRDKIRNHIIKSNSILDVTDLADQFDVSPRLIREIADQAQSEHYLVLLADNRQTVAGGKAVDSQRQRLLVNERVNSHVFRFGVTSDEHICSHKACVTELHALFDIFQERGIKTVLNCGNWIDGHKAGINDSEITHTTLRDQVAEFVRLYPQRDGITTHFIAGDDHEGWYQQRTGLQIGAYAQEQAEKAGRFDLKYLGYQEYDYTFVNPAGGVTKVRLSHPGGGSSYALSYKPQKIVESFAPRDRPDVLLIGHYHKSGVFQWQGVRTILCGCLQAQTNFMRKNGLAAHIGGWIVELHVNDEGRVVRMITEWIGLDPMYSNGPLQMEENEEFYVNSDEIY